MANVNKVVLIGRLTRDPEVTSFANGGKVAEIGFAVNNRKKNQQTGDWEEVPVWVELKAFNREPGRKLADLAENHLRKGHQVYVEGHLALEQWTAKDDGGKRSRTYVYVDNIEFLEKRAEGAAAPAGTAGEAKGGAAKERDLEEVPF